METIVEIIMKGLVCSSEMANLETSADEKSKSLNWTIGDLPAKNSAGIKWSEWNIPAYDFAENFPSCRSFDTGDFSSAPRIIKEVSVPLPLCGQWASWMVPIAIRKALCVSGVPDCFVWPIIVKQDLRSACLASPVSTRRKHVGMPAAQRRKHNPVKVDLEAQNSKCKDCNFLAFCYF